MAGRQHGRVTSAQLQDVGFSREAIRKRCAAHALHLVTDRVYAVGYPRDTPAARLITGTLAYEGAAVARASAAFLHGMLRFEPREVHLVDSRRRRSRPGFVVHPVRALADADVYELDGIRVTTPVRTLFDLATSASDRALRRAVAQALIDELVTENQLRIEIDRRRGRRGIKRLRALLDTGTVRTRSDLEDVAVALVRDHGLPKPQTNAIVFGEEGDLYWPELGLIAEIDGAAYHENIVTRRNDQRKQAHWEANKLRVLRLSEDQIATDLRQCAVRIAHAIDERRRLLSA